MFDTVQIPVWLLVLILLFAAATLLTHFINPPVRWFFRRRMERAVERLNKRLERPIQPFKLARRHDMIQRLIYDPKVAEAVTRHARETGMREDVAFAEARRYAREIVPSFSASAYFGVAIRAARWLSTRLYDIRLGEIGQAGMQKIDPDATVIFVMNHRSNTDYVLVTYLVADRSALSYAVGEWAQVWPLSRLIRAMGAYFIRRKSRNTLYRRVLARYVQLSTQAGVTQAIFPEGGLSLTGSVGAARLGLLSYIVSDFDMRGRDVVFVPISLNYDRVIEDRILVEAAQSGERRFRASFLRGAFFAGRWLRRRITGRAKRFGMAAVTFGEPLSLKAFLAARAVTQGDVTGERGVTAIAQEVMQRIRKGVPALPVPLFLAALIEGCETLGEIELWMARRVEMLRASGAVAHLREDSISLTARDALERLRVRRMLDESGGRIKIAPGRMSIAAFYAASVGDPLADDAAPQENEAIEPRLET
ncbi:1-acyl-sn-glycerol-3-phosphate acyltransferase [Profundibacterium mesophilum]|nr:1-acyl-sn-glycerol-3-phosphate acyltransferase [Profundibacterium mesophilum]